MRKGSPRTLPRRLTALLLALAVLYAPVPWTGAAGETHATTVLFTNDLHSRLLPQKTEGGGESGGCARLKTALDRERAKSPDALVLDGGGFSSGSLIQTLCTTQAAELRTMGAMGYDAAAISGRELDHTGAGFAKMLSAAVLSSDPAPALLAANLAPAPDDPNKLDIQRAMAAYGVKESLLLERGGITYGIFGLMGGDSAARASESGFVLEDPAGAAQRCVDDLKSKGAQFIICLSHSGTSEKKKLSEDERLAEHVEGIDLIISGHTHAALEQPVLTGGTYIVSAGSDCRHLGTITLEWSDGGEKTLTDYRLTGIDGSLPDDPEIESMVEGWKAQVEGTYLNRYGLTYDQTLTTCNFDLPLPDSETWEGSSLGELAADACLWAAQNLEADAPGAAEVAFTAGGTLRAPLYAGEIITSMVFDALPTGAGEDGTSGSPLVDFWLTGKELRAAAEADAASPAVQLSVSGMSYSFNVHRVFLNRVTEAYLREPPWANGNGAQGLSKLEDDRLYRVVCGMSAAGMLGEVRAKPFGLLSIEPKDENGTPITDFSGRALRQEDGGEIEEWYALAAYLESFGEEGLPRRYAAPDGRRQVSRSWNPVELLKNPNWITLAALLALVLFAVLMALAVRKVSAARRARRYGKRKYRI